MAVALASHDVHVWYCLTEDPPWPEVLERYLALLASDERARYDRFFFDKDRRQFLLARVLLRTLLSSYGAAPPQAWTFAHGPQGKPRLAAPADPAVRDLEFNHSHADRLVVCAFTRGAPVGVDVEWAGRDVDGRTARYFLSAAELDQLAGLGTDARRAFLMQRWTLKEAYAKARGLGLTLPFTQITCCCDPVSPPRLQLDAALGDDPARWQLRQWLVEGDHWVALAWRQPTGAPTRVCLTRLVPPLEAAERAVVAVDRPAMGC